MLLFSSNTTHATQRLCAGYFFDATNAGDSRKLRTRRTQRM